MPLFDKFSAALPFDAFLDRYGSAAHRDRWRQVLEQVTLTPEQRQLLASFKRTMNVMVLAGAWCGDCASQCPIFERFVQACPVLKVRYLDNGDHPDAQRELRVNGGDRVPVAVFFSEDGHEVGRYGDRTLSKYRALVEQQTGESCASGIVTSGDPLLARVTQDWLNEFERVQWLLRLSPRLRQLHRD
jgi:thiol-disulfide isomerase/thioredoxin